MDTWGGGGMKEGKIQDWKGRHLNQPNVIMTQLQPRRLLLVGLFLGVLFNPEDGGDVFLWNGGLFPTYMALELRRPYSPYPPLWGTQIQRSDSMLRCSFLCYTVLVSRNNKSVIRNKLRAFLEIDHIYTSEITFTQNFFKIQQLIQKLKGGLSHTRKSLIRWHFITNTWIWKVPATVPLLSPWSWHW
jgi:hypothetical protein